jgi:uncharacterized protein YciI
MRYYLLLYEFVDGFVDKRTPFRPDHLALVEAAHQRGELVMAGAYGDPPTGGALVFRAESPAPIAAFVENDPYVRNGLVRAWSVEPWHVVTGGI